MDRGKCAARAWHNRWEYANDYGANQSLASRGFVVLSVDHRLSVGYGQAFQFPGKGRAARRVGIPRTFSQPGRYLQIATRGGPEARIGIWGASARWVSHGFALGRNPMCFAAGVDIHGAHDRLPAVVTATQLAHAPCRRRHHGKPIFDRQLKVAVRVFADISRRRTLEIVPVLLHSRRRYDTGPWIFSQTVDLTTTEGQGRQGRVELRPS